MPRNMSFALTTEQIKSQTKFVTRRFGWGFVKPGDIINACEKCMGLKKGEKVQKICQIRVVRDWWEPLNRISKEHCVLEGFPEMEPEDFVNMIVKHYGCEPHDPIHVIEFDYI